ncbi:MAG TPA: hypothetical protein EYO73_11210 [Sulfurimonas sp.]|nr:hypothetical protein [Sulfurimonas sp.]
MNTLIHGFHWKSQGKSIKKLEIDGVLDVKVWVGKQQYYDGIFLYHSNLNYKEILDFKINNAQVEKDYNHLIQTTVNRIVDNGHIANFFAFANDENTNYLKQSLKQIIKDL